jgi:hypothetical protein
VVILAALAVETINPKNAKKNKWLVCRQQGVIRGFFDLLPIDNLSSGNPTILKKIPS